MPNSPNEVDRRHAFYLPRLSTSTRETRTRTQNNLTVKTSQLTSSGAPTPCENPRCQKFGTWNETRLSERKGNSRKRKDIQTRNSQHTQAPRKTSHHTQYYLNQHPWLLSMRSCHSPSPVAYATDERKDEEDREGTSDSLLDLGRPSFLLQLKLGGIWLE